MSRKIALSDLAHLVTDRDDRPDDLFLGHQQDADLHNAHQKHGDGDDGAYHILGGGKSVDVGLGPFL